MIRFVLVTMMLAACAPVQESPGVASTSADRVWTLQTLRGDKLTTNVVTLKLNPDRSISGTAACNSTSSAKLRWLGEPGATHGVFDRLGQGAGISTTALCRDRDAVAIAVRFWDSMETARAWFIDGRNLVIEFADGSQANLVLINH